MKGTLHSTNRYWGLLNNVLFRRTVKFYSVLFLTLLTVFVFSACKKQTGNVFLPNEGTQGFDGNGYTDSFTLWTHTVREDSLKTDSLSHSPIGYINEATFGQYKASAFCQYQLPQFNNVLSGTLDSVVIFVQYTSTTAYYGDLNSTIDLNVYELTEDMSSSKSHSNNSYNYNTTPVGTFSGKFRPTDSITVRDLTAKTRVAPTLRIAIPKTNPLAIKLFNAAAADLVSQSSFLQYFKGLAFVPTTLPAQGGGAVAAFNFLGAYSKIRIYYNDSMQSDFRVYTDSKRLTKYEISNQGAEISKQKGASKSASFDTGYVQAMTGAKMKIQIPYLFGIAKGKNVSIAKAELIVRPLAGSYNAPFTLPSRLLLLQPSSVTGLNTGILDLLEPFYGGNYNLSINAYKFNITRHVQNLFIDYQRYGKNSNNGLFLIVPTDFPVAPSRMMIDTRKKLQGMGIEFKLYYAEL